MKRGKSRTNFFCLVLVLFVAGFLSTLLFASREQAAASVTITEFSDFQCPYCKRAASVVAQIRSYYGDRVKVVFKQMPLQMHQHAFKAAQASVCAGEQGKFWEYHDRLFAAADLSVDELNRIAATVELNQTAFSQCLSSEKSKSDVEQDVAEAARLGVSGTPTFFVNGQMVRSAATFGGLQQEIESALRKPRTPLRSSGEEDSIFVRKTSSIPVEVSAPKHAAALARAATRADYMSADGPAPSTTAAGVTLSPASLNFGYQLIGTSGSPITETVTNSGTLPVAITELSVSGHDRSDFAVSCNCSLPLTLVPGDSIEISITFTPAAPWRAGSRNARLEISEKKDSQYFALTGMGVTCGGPLPSCSSGCTDSDDDGLNDAWEVAGGIDINNDGQIDAINDVLLPAADPSRPDVYVKYDYMVYTSTTPNPFGDGPHSHQPLDAAIQQVVDSFAAHGINLHIDPQHDAIPEVFVTTLDPNPTVACAANGASGGGYTFVSMKTLRQQHLGDRKWAYHYAVFAHSHTVPDTAPCCDGSCGTQPCTACARDAACGGSPDPSSSGVSEINGSSFILAFGTLADNNGIRPSSIAIESQASIFMHELGHNFGLMHGSLAPSLDPVLTTRQQACLAWKPNYISVMDYSYSQNGISIATQPGSTTPRHCNVDSDCPTGAHCTNDLDFPGGGNICYRVDYADQTLLTLNEASLNEMLGVGGTAGQTDIVPYCGPTRCGLVGPSFGPIDWNDNGAIETNVQSDVDGNPLGTPNRVLSTTSDWDKLNFKFQCTTAFANDVGATAGDALVQSSISTPELSHRYAREHHILYPPAAASLVSTPECANPSRSRTPNVTRVAILGSTTFDVSQVDFASLNMQGARPFDVSVDDVNNDGIRDLVLQFRKSEIRVPWNSIRVHLTGWLKNSRSFVGETEWAADCQE